MITVDRNLVADLNADLAVEDFTIEQQCVDLAELLSLALG